MSQESAAIERRFLAAEVRMEEIDGQRHIIGYGARFNIESEDLGGFVETIEPGAFSRSLAEGADVRGLFNHDSSLILGRTSAQTMILTEDDLGLRYDIIVPDTSYANDLLVSLERGDVSQSSFGFRAVTDRWEQRGGLTVRYLMDTDLFDTGPVTFPAYPVTSAEARASAAECADCAGASTAAGGAVVARRLQYKRRQLDLLERL